MVAGLVAMQKLTHQEFERLDRLGAMLREGLAEAMDGARVRGQVTGMGSLTQIHLHDRPLSDYRSSTPTAEEAHRGNTLPRPAGARHLHRSDAVSVPVDADG